MIGHLAGMLAEFVFVSICKQNFHNSKICITLAPLLHEGVVEPVVNALTISSVKNAYKEGALNVTAAQEAFENLTLAKLLALMVGSMAIDQLVAKYVSNHVISTTISGILGGAAIEHFYDEYSSQIFCSILSGAMLLLGAQLE